VIDVTTGIEPAFTTAPHTVDALDDGARLWLWHLASTLPDGLMNRLIAELEWEQPEIRLFGRWHRIPRLQHWCADEGVSYRYSGRTLPAAPWSHELGWLRQITEQLTGLPFNSVLVNLYRDGSDAMGWHADDEAELGPTPWIASWSFGTSRDFCLRRKGESRTGHRITLEDSTLLLMSPEIQQHWQHALPRRQRVRQARLNLTFRQVLVSGR
jgi:alkylated DNA repair dioxygenase AlkB